MTTDPLPLASAVRIARHAGRLSCGHHVHAGAVIVRQGRWSCLKCALGAASVHPNLRSLVAKGTP